MITARITQAVMAGWLIGRASTAVESVISLSEVEELNRSVMKLGSPRSCPVSTFNSTLIPTRNDGLSGALLTRMRIGVRWTTLTQLPLVFSAGSNEKLDADAGLMLSTVRTHR